MNLLKASSKKRSAMALLDSVDIGLKAISVGAYNIPFSYASLTQSGFV